MGLQLIKTNYFYPNRKGDGFDKVLLVTKNEKGEKDFTVVNKPVLEYHISNEKADPELEYRSIPEDLTNKYKCYYKDLFQSMVHELNDPEMTEYYNSIVNSPNKQGMRKALNKIHLDYRFHGTDVNIEDYYIGKFLDKHPAEENNYKLTKFFYDIEVDGSTIVGFPEAEQAQCEVNIISACMDMGDYVQFYMFCLNYEESENPSYVEFISNLKENVTPIKEEMMKKAGKEVKIAIKRFRNEVNLIKAFFNTINDLRPDFVMGWNTARFDFPYLYNRLGILLVNEGETIEEVMCPKEFPYKSASYRIDYDHPDAPDNNSIMNVASYSVHMDQQNLYGNLRKGKGKLESYSLDAIAELELGEHKKELTTNIKTQHFDDYLNFFKYSAQDTLLLYLLEEKNQDIEMLNAVSTITRTRVEHCLKKTVCLRNLAAKFYLNDNRIISNNRSALKHKDGKPRGAFVANMTQVAKMGMRLFEDAELSQFVFEEVCDLDLSSLYPSIIIALNLAPETFIKKLNIELFNEQTMEWESCQDVFIDEYIAKDYVFMGDKYCGLPNMDELAELALQEELALVA